MDAVAIELLKKSVSYLEKSVLGYWVNLPNPDLKTSYSSHLQESNTVHNSPGSFVYTVILKNSENGKMKALYLTIIVNNSYTLHFLLLGN